MNYYKATENFLYNYNSLKASIQNMKQEIKEIDHHSISAINYEKEPTSETHKFYSDTEEKAIRAIERKEQLKLNILITESKLKRIDRAIDALNDNEKQVIYERYIKGRQWWEVAYKVKYNERWCKELRRRAINKIAIGLYGEKAMHEDSTNRARKTG